MSSEYSQSPSAEKTVIVLGEQHKKRDCCYYRLKLKYNKTWLYVFYRNCVCGLSDKSPLFETITDGMTIYTSIQNEDGVEVHNQAGCKIHEVDERRPNFIRKFKLECYCPRGKQVLSR